MGDRPRFHSSWTGFYSNTGVSLLTRHLHRGQMIRKGLRKATEGLRDRAVTVPVRRTYRFEENAASSWSINIVLKVRGLVQITFFFC